MKKLLILSLMLFTIVSISVGQTDNVSRAFKLMETKKYDAAKVCIDSAITMEKFSNRPRTWYVRGFIYKAIYVNNEKGNKESPSRIKALESFKKSMDVDSAHKSIQQNKSNMQFLTSTIYSDAMASLDTTHYKTGEKLFKDFKKYFVMHNDSKAALQKFEVDYKLGLADVYTKLYEGNKNLTLKKKYYNAAIQQYDDILKVADNEKAKAGKAALVGKSGKN